MNVRISLPASGLYRPDLDRITALTAASGAQDETPFRNFFVVPIRNRNTRVAYARTAWSFCGFAEGRGIASLAEIRPVHVAAWVEALSLTHAPATVKLRLAGLRRLFDWLVLGQALPYNPAASVRGPRLIVNRGKTPVLAREDARLLLESICTDTAVGLRDQAYIGLLVYSFARVGAAVGMRVEDFHLRGRRW